MTFPLLWTLAVIAAVGGGFWVGWWSKCADAKWRLDGIRQIVNSLTEENTYLKTDIKLIDEINDTQQSQLFQADHQNDTLQASLREQEQATRLLGEKVKRMEDERLSFVRDSSGRFRKREG